MPNRINSTMPLIFKSFIFFFILIPHVYNLISLYGKEISTALGYETATSLIFTEGLLLWILWGSLF